MVKQIQPFIDGKGVAGGATITFAITTIVKAIQDGGIPLNPAQTTLALCLIVAALIGILEQKVNANLSKPKQVATYILTFLTLLATLYFSTTTAPATVGGIAEIKTLTEAPK